MNTVRGDSSDEFTRVPPQDLEAEQAALGSMLLSPQALIEVRSVLTDTDWYRPAHQAVFEAVCALHDRGEPADQITVVAELERRGELARIGGVSYVITLVNSVPTAATGEWYAERVRECAVRRHAIEAHTRAIQDLYAGAEDLPEMCDRHEAELHAAHRDARTRTPYRRIGDIMEQTIDDQEDTESRQGVLTGFQDLDQLTNGFQPGELVVVAARPAVGKSTLVMDFLRAVAIQQNIPTALFSLEMGDLEIGQRVLSAEAGVGLHRIRGYTLTEDDWTRIGRRLPDVIDAPMFIDTSPNLTMAEIATRAREMHSREGIELLAVDYLQLLESGRRSHGNRQEEVAQISRRLKLLAKELNIPVIALSQLNRGPESREDKKPMVSDLRESGAVEQDADMVILLHRPDVYEKESPRAGEADLIMGKCRNAPTCTITVAFAGHISQFKDMAPVPGTASDYRNTLPRRESPTKASDALPAPRAARTLPPASAGPESAVQDPSGGSLTAPPPAEVPEAPVEPEPTAAEPTPSKAVPRRKAPNTRAQLNTYIADKVARALDEHGGDQDAALNALAGDGGSAIPDVMDLWAQTRVETAYEPTAHPEMPDPLIRKRKDGADDVWEARPKYRSAQPVPEGVKVTELDINAAYLGALQSAHLPVRTITHNPVGDDWSWDNLDCYGRGRDLAGIVRIKPVAWDHPHLPNPLGDDRETTGSLWIPTSILLSLRDFASPAYGSLCEEPKILEAYVAPGTAALFKTLVQILNQARMDAIEADDFLTKRYVSAMYSKLVSTMGDSRANHDLRRPDWVHIIRGTAFANLRRKAVRAYEAGLGIVHVGGTDELHLTGDVWSAQRNGKPLFVEGRALNQIKAKNVRKGGDR